MKILAVDDDLVFLELLVAVLSNAGYDDVMIAQSAVDALQLLRSSQTSFECLLLDVNMPDWDGVELCAAVRALPQYSLTPILMVTALSSKFSIDRAFVAGATDYVTKPLNGLELGSRLRIAATLNAAHKCEREATALMFSLPYHDGDSHEVALSKQLELTGVENAIEFHALQNYLERIKPGIYNMSISSYCVAQVKDIHARVSFAEFRRIINEVGRAISLALDGTRFFLAYAGCGIFVVLFEGRSRKEELSIQSVINVRITSLVVTNRDRSAATVEVNARRLSRRTTSTPASLIEDLTKVIWKVEDLTDIEHLWSRLETETLKL